MKNQIHFSYLIIFIFLISCSSPENETDPTPIQPSTTEYSLTVSSGPGGTVSTSGGTYEEGSTVNVTATPNSEYIFQNWSNGSTDNPLTVTVNQNITLTATFIKRQYPLTINIQGEGTVREEIVSSGKSTPTEYNSGTVVRLTADPTGDWVFEEWTGNVTETSSTITITLDEPKSVNVRFMRYFNYNQPSTELFYSEFRISPESLSRREGIFQEEFGNYITSVCYADFNSDGYIDVLYAPGNNTITRTPIELYYNSGDNENFIFQTDIILNNIGGEGVRKSLIGDFNLDGKPDVFFADHGAEPSGASVTYDGAFQSILMSNSSGYEFSILDQLPKSFTHGAASGDFDKDGDLDIFLSNGGFLINDGIGNFTLNDQVYNGTVLGPSTVEMKDLNKDGFLDLIIGGNHFRSWELSAPTIFWGNGIDFINERSTILPEINRWGVSIDFDFFDLNGDGFDEIILNLTGGFEDSNGNVDWSLFYTGWRVQVIENINGDEFIDRTEDYMDVYENLEERWTVWYRIEDIDNDGQIELFDDDPTHQTTGIDQIWDWNGSMFIKK